MKNRTRGVKVLITNHGFLSKFFGILATTLLFLFIVFILIDIFNSPRPHYTPESRKINDILLLYRALEFYAEDHDGFYPLLPPSCADVDNLEAHLVPRYLHHIPAPIDRQGGYSVAVGPERTTFVIRVSLRDIGHAALKTDVDHHVLGCDCADPAYCVMKTDVAASPSQ